jgi:hypothetical protein
VASAVLLLRSSFKNLETAIQSGSSSEKKIELLAKLKDILQSTEATLATLPSA